MSIRHATERYAAGRTPLLSVSELAAFLGVHRVTVYDLEIPYVVVGARRRYRLRDVEQYLERGREPAP